MESCVWAMLVARPGPLRDSLRALVSAIPFTDAFVVENASAALDNLHQCHPALVVVDFDPADASTWPLMDALSAQSPAVRHIFLVDTVEEQRLVLSSGAKVALLKGFSASRLHRVIKGLLPRSEEERALYQPVQLQNGVRTSEVAVAL
jgi:DNA-binding response OmpR family regulator